MLREKRFFSAAYYFESAACLFVSLLCGKAPPPPFGHPLREGDIFSSYKNTPRHGVAVPLLTLACKRTPPSDTECQPPTDACGQHL